MGSILAIQIAALIWGIFTVYQQRPVALAFWEYRFYTVTYKQIANEFKGSSELQNLISQPLGFFYVPKPSSNEKIDLLLKETQVKDLAPFELIDRYQPAKDHIDSITKHSVDIDEIINTNFEMKKQLLDLLNPIKANVHDFYYIPLISRYQNIVFIFSKDNFDLQGYLKAPYKDIDANHSN